jgi:hypothetical protein
MVVVVVVVVGRVVVGRVAAAGWGDAAVVPGGADV